MLIDWLIIGLYLLSIALIGTLAARKVKSSSSFFISDRRFGKGMMMMFAFGTGTNTDQAVSVASKTYTAGASGIWYQWLWLFVTPFYWVLAPLFRRMRAVTTADYLAVRYGKSVAVLFALTGIVQLSVNIGVVLKASGAMIAVVSGGAISASFAIILITLLFMSYGVAGGLRAAIITDSVQGVMTVVLSFLLLPFALNAVGGLDGLRATVNDPSVFQIVAPAEITTLYVIVLALNALVGWVATPYSMAMVGAGKTEHESRIGMVGGMFLKRICTIAWVLTAMCGIGMYAGTAIDPDQVYGLIARDLLPSVAPGLVGLFIASMLAAVMSSCDAMMVAGAALFTENVYKPHLCPDRNDKHYMVVGRVTAIAIVVAAILISFGLSSVVQGLEIYWEVSAMMGITIWISFFWRRATVAGAWASTVSGFAAWFLTSTIDSIGWDFNGWFAQYLPEFMLYDGILSLPWQMITYLSVSLITMVGVSLFTRQPDKERLDRVYECLRTPVQAGEPEVEPLTLPKGMEPAPRLVLINHPDFELCKPALDTIVGFIAAALGVAALISAFVWILR